MLLATHSPEAARAQEVRRHLDVHRGRLRSLAEARCAGDFRLLAGTFRLRDGYWLWTIGERRTPSQVREDAHEWHQGRCLDAAIDGADPDNAEKLPWDDDGSEAVSSDTWPSSATRIGEPVEAYRSTTIDQVRDTPGGLFGSCSKCRQTFGINYLLMRFVTGKVIVKRANRPLVVRML
jgi:hypothetical protein